MPKLVSKNVDIADRRVEDTTSGKEYVLAHNQTEADIADIFGIPKGTNITGSILGTVGADGGITLIRFKRDGPVGSVDDSPGIEFRDGIKTKRISFAGSKIQVWEKDGTTWEAQHDYEDQSEPSLISKEDVVDYYSRGKVLGVSLFPVNGRYVFLYYSTDYLEGGATNLKEMSDVSINSGDLNAVIGFYKSGLLLGVNSDKVNPKFTLLQPPEDRREYGIFMSEPCKMNYNVGTTFLGFANLPGGNSGEFDDSISISNDGLNHYPRSEFAINRGVWFCRLRFVVESRNSKAGHYRIGPVNISNCYIMNKSNAIQQCQDGIVGGTQAQGEKTSIIVATGAGSSFRIGGTMSANATGASTCRVIVELERIN